MLNVECFQVSTGNTTPGLRWKIRYQSVISHHEPTEWHRHLCLCVDRPFGTHRQDACATTASPRFRSSKREFRFGEFSPSIPLPSERRGTFGQRVDQDIQRTRQRFGVRRPSGALGEAHGFQRDFSSPILRWALARMNSRRNHDLCVRF